MLGSSNLLSGPSKEINIIYTSVWRHISYKLEKNYKVVIGKLKGLGLISFYDISTIIGYLIPNPVYRYILNIHDLVCLGFMAYQHLLLI